MVPVAAAGSPSEFVEAHYPLVRSHRGTAPDLVLRWNAVATSGPVDVVIHFHGYSGAREGMRIDTEKLRDSGLDFRDPRSGALGRTRPTLGILPRGNYFGGDSGIGYNFPALVKPGAVDRLIEDSLERLARQTGLILSRGRVILTGHSGGGAPLTRVVEAVDPDEVHVFDGMYGSGAAIARWARARIVREIATPGPIPPAMRVLYRPGSPKHPGTEPWSEDLAREICGILRTPGAERLAPRFRVDRTTVGHMQIPRRFGWVLLTDASATLDGTVTWRCSGSRSNESEEYPVAESFAEQEAAHSALEALDGWIASASVGEAEASSPSSEWQPENLERDQPENLDWEAPMAVATGDRLGEASVSEESDEEVPLGSAEEWPGALNAPYGHAAALAEGASEEREVAFPSEAEESPRVGNSAYVEFREAVLQAHLDLSRRRKGLPGRDLAPADLGPVAGTDVRMRHDAAEAAGRLIAAANHALARARQDGDPDALATSGVSASSGYRSSDHQARLWRSYFPGYYRQTERARESLLGGPHGPAAVRYMIDVFGVPNWIAAPGYSNHQSGIAIDLAQVRRAGSEIRNSGNRTQLARWRASWLHRWLVENAGTFGFQPYRREPWHWEFREARADRLSELAQPGDEQSGEELDVAEGYEGEALSRAADSEGEQADEESLEGPTAPVAGANWLQLDPEVQGLLDAKDEDYFEARVDAPFQLTGETQGSAATGANDPPTRAVRPRWPGRRLRLIKRPFMRGADVRAWQQRMIERNWHTALGRPFTDDGVFGPQTAIVTTRFQQVQALPVTGVVDAVTWAAAWTTGARTTPVAAAPAVLYDRGAAFDYARNHWNTVCSDGFIAGTFGTVAFKPVPLATRFVNDGNGTEHALLPDGKTIPWSDLDDCTHFISCCIGQPPGGASGGLPINGQLGTPPNAPYGVVRVSSLVAFLTKQKWVAIEGERAKDVSLIGRLQRGDLVAYFNEKRGRYTHLAFYLGNGKIACHTYCRFDKTVDPACTWDDDWDLGAGTNNFTWTFLRFVV